MKMFEASMARTRGTTTLRPERRTVPRAMRDKKLRRATIIL
jgi:hypothetical protein